MFTIVISTILWWAGAGFPERCIKGVVGPFSSVQEANEFLQREKFQRRTDKVWQRNEMVRKWDHLHDRYSDELMPSPLISEATITSLGLHLAPLLD